MLNIIFIFICYVVFLQVVILGLRYKDKYEAIKNAIGTKEAIKILGIKKERLYKLVSENVISPIIDGGRYLFLKEDVTALAERKEWRA